MQRANNNLGLVVASPRATTTWDHAELPHVPPNPTPGTLHTRENPDYLSLSLVSDFNRSSSQVLQEEANIHSNLN